MSLRVGGELEISGQRARLPLMLGEEALAAIAAAAVTPDVGKTAQLPSPYMTVRETAGPTQLQSRQPDRGDGDSGATGQSEVLTGDARAEGERE